MTIKMKELPISERPYEKLEMYGEKTLSDAELLAIIIKSGTRNETSVELARRILKLNTNVEKSNLNFLRELTIEELTKINGIGKVKAIQLKALCEFAKRMNKPQDYRKIRIKTPKDVDDIMRDDMIYLKNEILRVIILNSSNEIIKIKDIIEGGANFINLNIKNILSDSVRIQAPKIILIHNHPSGNSSPSEKDIEFTENIKNACEILGIQLLDHIVIARDGYSSIFSIQNKIKK